MTTAICPRRVIPSPCASSAGWRGSSRSRRRTSAGRADSFVCMLHFSPRHSPNCVRFCARLDENVEFLSSFSRLGIVRTAFGSALGLSKTLNKTKIIKLTEKVFLNYKKIFLFLFDFNFFIAERHPG